MRKILLTLMVMGIGDSYAVGFPNLDHEDAQKLKNGLSVVVKEELVDPQIDMDTGESITEKDVTIYPMILYEYPVDEVNPPNMDKLTAINLSPA